MKTTKLANKKLNMLHGKKQVIYFENAIRSKLIYDDLPEKDGFVVCTVEKLWIIAYRAWYYGISIIGIESNTEQDVPFYVFYIEDYETNTINFGEHNPTQWILSAAIPIILKHPGIQLKFYIDIPEMNIPIIEKTTGISLKSEFCD